MPNSRQIFSRAKEPNLLFPAIKINSRVVLIAPLQIPTQEMQLAFKTKSAEDLTKPHEHHQRNIADTFHCVLTSYKSPRIAMPIVFSLNHSHRISSPPEHDSTIPTILVRYNYFLQKLSTISHSPHSTCQSLQSGASDSSQCSRLTPRVLYNPFHNPTPSFPQTKQNFTNSIF